MRIRRIIMRVLVVLASLNLVAGPVLAGAQSINLKAQGNLTEAADKAKKAKDATRALNLLGDQPWGEALQKGLFGGTKLTAANVLEGALDGAITSGINSAVHGTSFKKGFTSSLVKNVVALGLADAQIGIGNAFNKKDADGNLVNGGEGSLGHILLHGAAGCAAAELTGASCGAGAAGAIVQVIYSRAVDPAEAAANPDRYATNAELIGLAAGYLFSGGKAENVAVASAVARSGFENNYLTHNEQIAIAGYAKACYEGGNAAACAQKDALGDLSEERDDFLESCEGSYTSACQQARVDLAVAAADYIDWVLDGNSFDDDFYGFANNLGLSRVLTLAAVHSDVQDQAYQQANIAFEGYSARAQAFLTGTPDQRAELVAPTLALLSTLAPIGPPGARGIVPRGGVRGTVGGLEAGLPRGYRELNPAGAQVSSNDLPPGFRRVLDPDGDIVFASPGGGIYRTLNSLPSTAPPQFNAFGRGTLADSYQAGSRSQALNQAKDAYGIPRSVQPKLTIKPNTPQGDKLGLDNRNGNAFVYQNSEGQAVIIRQDNPATYGFGNTVGNQPAHYNGGVVKDFDFNPNQIQSSIEKASSVKLPTHFYWE